MGKTDVLDQKLLKMLEREPRATYRSLAQRLGTSVATVQRRVEGLMASGRLGQIRARLSMGVLGGTTLLVHGSAQVKLTPQVIDGLGDHGTIKFLSLGMFDHVYCIAQIRKAEEIDGLIAFLVERIGLRDHQVLVIRNDASLQDGVKEGKDDGGQRPELKNIDLRIVRSLSYDGRKSISDIAQDTGVSSRTVKRRLDRMIVGEMIEFEMDFHIALERDIMFNILIEFDSIARRNEFLIRTANDRDTVFDDIALFLNAPDQLFVDGMVQTLADLDQLITSLLKQEGIVRILPDIIIRFCSYDTWVNRISRGEREMPIMTSKSTSPKR